jgi:hypothetical protein
MHARRVGENATTVCHFGYALLMLRSYFIIKKMEICCLKCKKKTATDDQIKQSKNGRQMANLTYSVNKRN